MLVSWLRKNTLKTLLGLVFSFGLSGTCCAKTYRFNFELPTTTGIASYYGRREQGKRTASGERFDRWKYTAASRAYPLGTLLMVKYPRMGTFVVVRVNDRGPWIKGRVLDLSEKAATTLGLKSHGVDFVIIQPLHVALG